MRRCGNTRFFAGNGNGARSIIIAGNGAAEKTEIIKLRRLEIAVIGKFIGRFEPCAIGNDNLSVLDHDGSVIRGVP